MADAGSIASAQTGILSLPFEVLQLITSNVCTDPTTRPGLFAYDSDIVLQLSRSGQIPLRLVCSSLCSVVSPQVFSILIINICKNRLDGIDLLQLLASGSSPFCKYARRLYILHLDPVRTMHTRNGGWEFYKTNSNPDTGPSSSAILEFAYAPDRSGDVAATVKERHGAQSLERMRTYLTDAIQNLENVREVKYVFFRPLCYHFAYLVMLQMVDK
jgi:hypothetical protein